MKKEEMNLLQNETKLNMNKQFKKTEQIGNKLNDEKKIKQK